jgi:hypothetical protein
VREFLSQNAPGLLKPSPDPTAFRLSHHAWPVWASPFELELTGEPLTSSHRQNLKVHVVLRYIIDHRELPIDMRNLADGDE